MSQRYRPLYKLDAGGMAEVYVAESESMAGFSKKVAIKRILPGLIKDERFVRMFLDEARISLRLNHANVVSVFDIGESDNTYFIVMEFVEGSNLKTLLEHQATRGGMMPVALTAWILNEILKGLHYAHNLTDPETGKPLGIVHRDVSPPNILVSWNGEVKLTDFGLAKATTQIESTDPGVVKGKYSYLSPEGAHLQEVDHRSDIFAVGILAFEMLTGRRLFKGKNDFQTIAMVRAAEVPSIRSINREVPEELERIIRKALAKDLKVRYATADDFAHDLMAFLFSKRMMVGARDLTEFCKPIREQRDRELAAQRRKADQERSPGGHNLIIDLIQEEMMHFRSIGEGQEPGHTGTMPVSGTSAGAAPLDLGNFGVPQVGASSSGSGSLGLSPTPAPVSAPDVPLSDALGFELPEVGSPNDRGDRSGTDRRRTTHRDVGAHPTTNVAIAGGRRTTQRDLSASRSGARTQSGKNQPLTPPMPPMPTVSESSNGLWLIIIAVVGVALVILLFMMSSK
ncbi:MAG: serine/threonine-protein kinase [Nannocystaceae bacterium]